MFNIGDRVVIRDEHKKHVSPGCREGPLAVTRITIYPSNNIDQRVVLGFVDKYGRKCGYYAYRFKKLCISINKQTKIL